MRVDRAMRDRAFHLLSHDLLVTLGERAPEAIRRLRRETRTTTVLSSCDSNEYVAAVVDTMQQWLHDNFVDTSWPACPIHMNHPLWLDDDKSDLLWRCPTTTQAVAPVGLLQVH